MDIKKYRLGTVVIASDGEAGTISHIIVQPGQRVVTHLGVKLNRGPGGTSKQVPLDRVSTASADETHLTITREALLQAMPDLGGNQTTLSRSTSVSVDGKSSGSLTQVTTDATTNKLYRFGAKGGIGSETLIDAAWLTDVDQGGRSLGFRVPAGAAPVAYRADTDLLEDARAALWNYARLRVDMRAVDIQVVDGEVWLRGHVSSTLNRRVMEELLEGLDGLIAVHNELVADNELAVTVARALSANPATHGQRIGVYPNLGKVYLRGVALTPEVSATATKIAAEISGTDEVVNDLAISAKGTFIPQLAPVTGNEDIVPGGD